MTIEQAEKGLKQFVTMRYTNGGTAIDTGTVDSQATITLRLRVSERRYVSIPLDLFPASLDRKGNAVTVHLDIRELPKKR